MADAFTQEIIRSKLLAVTSEMGTILARTSMGPIVYEVLDFACGITDATGAVISRDNGLCLFTGTFSAWGMLTSKPRLDLSRTLVLALAENPAAKRSAIFAEMEAESESALFDQRFAAERIAHTRSIDCRYHGQEHTVRVLSDIQEESESGSINFTSSFTRSDWRTPGLSWSTSVWPAQRTIV